jgi:superfamily I DNA/RNA helicase
MASLFNEIEDFICGFGLKSIGEYLEVERHGRREPLTRPKREYVWKVHALLKERLRERKLTTFTRRAFAAFVYTQTLDPQEKYDYLFIDEAQDLRPIQIRLCMNLCKDPKNIFLTADVNQGIYNTGTSWQSISAELRFQGRTMLLKRNHRNSAAISSAIQLLAPNGTETDRETLGLDSRDPQGSKPTIVRVRGGLVDEASIRRVADFLEAGAIEERVGFGCCAILVPTKGVGELWQERLPAHFNARFFESATVDIGHPGVKLLTIHASKGLQFPVVSVVGITKDALKFLGPKDDPEAADEVRRRLLFVACSRAMRHLLLQTSSDDPTDLLDSALTRRDLWNIEEVSGTDANSPCGLEEDLSF